MPDPNKLGFVLGDHIQNWICSYRDGFNFESTMVSTRVWPICIPSWGVVAAIHLFRRLHGPKTNGWRCMWIFYNETFQLCIEPHEWTCGLTCRRRTRVRRKSIQGKDQKDHVRPCTERTMPQLATHFQKTPEIRSNDWLGLPPQTSQIIHRTRVSTGIDLDR